MKDFLHLYPNSVIGTLAVIFLGIILVFSLWTVGDVVTEIHSALILPPQQSVTGFDLAGAAKLGLGSH